MDLFIILFFNLTFLCIIFLLKKQNKKIKNSINKKQSDTHNFLKTFFSRQPYQKQKLSQKTQRTKKNDTNVVILENTAYWVRDNVFYFSDIVDGKPNIQNAKPVDILNMPKSKLDKMLFIVDNLTGGKNERGSTGN